MASMATASDGASGGTTRPVDAVAHEFGDPARIVDGKHGLARFHRFQRDESHVLLERNEHDEVRARVVRHQIGVRQSPDEADPRIARGERAQCRARGTVACDHQRRVGPAPPVRPDQEIEALRPVVAACREDEFAGLVAKALEIGRMRHDLDCRAGRKIPLAPRDGLRDGEMAAHRALRKADPVERMDERPGQWSGERDQAFHCVRRNARVGAQRIHLAEDVRQRDAVQRGPLQQLPEPPGGARQMARAQREFGGVGVVQAPQRVLEIHDVVLVRDHPRRILGRDHHVEAGEIERREFPVALRDLPEIALRRRQRDEFHRVPGVAVDIRRQARPEPFRAAGRERHRARGDQRDSHGPMETLASMSGSCATPVKKVSVPRTTSNTRALSHQS